MRSGAARPPPASSKHGVFQPQSLWDKMAAHTVVFLCGGHFEEGSLPYRVGYSSGNVRDALRAFAENQEKVNSGAGWDVDLENNIALEVDKTEWESLRGGGLACRQRPRSGEPRSAPKAAGEDRGEPGNGQADHE
ncbi:uncharacterized protein LOC143665483 [Tamandua tetradactyla]|uniref:uncharacterized protein LOC143665483 n=1 Tax=Tamandua tetradactyla TaxID=48850 RepID=UPI0040544E3D